MNVLHEAWFWVIVAAASELVALSPMKENSLLQLGFRVLGTFKPKR